METPYACIRLNKVADTLSHFPFVKWSAGRRQGFARPHMTNLCERFVRVPYQAGLRVPLARRARYGIDEVAKLTARTLRLPALHVPPFDERVAVGSLIPRHERGKGERRDRNIIQIVICQARDAQTR